MLLLSCRAAPCKMPVFSARGISLPLAAPILQTTLADRRPDRQGKVRDIYDFGDRLLIVATDRISAFDYVLGSGIPDKGKVLTQISAFWFERTRAIVAESPALDRSGDVSRPKRAPTRRLLRGRSMLVTTDRAAADRVRRARLPVRLGLEGLRRRPARSAASRLPAGLRESDRLPRADLHAGDQGAERPRHQHQRGRGRRRSSAGACSTRVRDLTLRLYAEGAAHAESRGIIVADTKFEFGLLPDDGRPDEDRVILIDEVLTPDSSRFWPRDSYAPGGPQPSFDKQFVRDYLERIHWNKQPPVPSLPDDVVAKTREKYLEAFRRLTGRELRRDHDQRAAREARRGDGRQGRPVRRRRPRVREAVHRARARPAATAA